MPPPSSKPRAKPHTIESATVTAIVRPAVAQLPVTPAAPEPRTVTCSNARRALPVSQTASSAGDGASISTPESSAEPPRTRTRPVHDRARHGGAVVDLQRRGAAPPSIWSPRALLPGSSSRSVAPDVPVRRRVASAPRPTTRTGRPVASANGPASLMRPSRIVSRSVSARAAANASAAVARSVQPAAFTSTQ